MRTVLFGVDGLSFRVLHPLMQRGELPNFQKLRDTGCEAILESKFPPLTPAAWTSISTGMKPAAHGVYDFWEFDEHHEPGTPRRAHIQTHRKGSKAIWNILSEYGKRVLVMNVPVTYPPEAVNGIMISGYMTPSSEVNFTYPLSIKEELYRAVPDYKIDLEHDDMLAIEPLLDATIKMTEQRISLMRYLMLEKAWDFCYVVFVGADRLQHPLWDEILAMEPKVIEYYRLLDAGLGFVMEQLGPEDTLFVVSDHGFQGAKRIFDINEYLCSRGLLYLHSNARRDKSVRSANLKYQLKRLGLFSLVRKFNLALKKNRADRLEKQDLDVYQPILADIDLTQTQAYVPSLSGFGGGYADIFLREDLDAQCISELCADLQNQVDPRTGKPLIEAIYTTEVYGTGPYAPREPHLLLLPSDGITFRMRPGNKRLWDDTNSTQGTHQKDGVLYAYGNNIKQGTQASPVEIYDIVPTVLHSMSLPLPGAFDGRILHEIFEEQKEPGSPKPEGDGRTRQKLESLLALIQDDCGNQLSSRPQS
ncbi:MAG TPA: alkaline phosphatase family protein [Ktedonobacteraceae bacterium]